jgi:hypothetical protein
MVFFNPAALTDIENIFIGLLEWKTKDNRQPIMSFDEVWNYRNDLFTAGNSIDKLSYHSKAQHRTHKLYGEYSYSYNRNRRTQWYFIYDREGDDVFINKILSNYVTY